MKLLFFGDSITDAGKNVETPSLVYNYGVGFVRMIADKVFHEDPEKYKIINRGNSGNRLVDMYARMKPDVWEQEPDVVTVLAGINDIWLELLFKNGFTVERYEKVYRLIIEETKQALPNVKMILCEPFVLKGSATMDTEEVPNKFEMFSKIYDYAKVVKKLAKEYDLTFLPLQEKFTLATKNCKVEHYLYDGVHPNILGANLIATEWVKCFKEKIEPLF